LTSVDWARNDPLEGGEALALAARTAVLIVHYGNPDLTSRAIRAVLEGSVKPGAVVVVDNDPLPYHVPQAPTPAQAFLLVRPDHNTGFAGGVSVGLEALSRSGLSCEFVWLLNNDARPEPDALGPLIEAIYRRDGKALVSSRVIDESDGAPWFERPNFQPWRLETSHNRTARTADDEVVISGRVNWREAAYLPGCSLLLSISELDRLGGLDQSFFMYGEDVDLAIRAQRAGCSLVVARRSIVLHSPSSSSSDARRERYIARATLQITIRYFPLLVAPAVLAGVITGFKRALQRREAWRLTSRIRGYADAIRWRWTTRISRG
jgi:N-acetylglucosaminyl-diphospho-decaprenol L-rhamnosyltransferase